ncbi:MAG: RNA-directed DNA polymerase, partial [Flammeovirgaceae bacterium]|nr:RNA-directed DNA polymerase [Flammeovirgaceae bacterium]
VANFRESLQEELFTLQQQLLSGNVQIGNYHYFTIYDPKERLICASSFPERVLQHAIMNICHPVFEKYQIYDSYACRVSKGTYAALEKAKQLARQNTYFAKLDVRKYFETIDHNLLKLQLSHLFKDKKLLQIFIQIIDSYANAPQKGLPIGNLSSQYFANHFLGKADHYIKEQLQVKAYLRYMDDMVIFGASLEEVKFLAQQYCSYLTRNLKCEMKPHVINSLAHGLPFLGYVVYPHRIGLAKRSRKRFRRKSRQLYHHLSTQKIDQAEFQRKMLPLLAFVEKSDAHVFQKKVILGLEDRTVCCVAVAGTIMLTTAVWRTVTGTILITGTGITAFALLLRCPSSNNGPGKGHAGWLYPYI